jgi:hypothetical protein
MASKFAPLPSASVLFVDKDGKPMPTFYQFILALSLSQNVGPLPAAATDAAAAQLGVRIGGLYETSGVVKIRKS